MNTCGWAREQIALRAVGDPEAAGGDLAAHLAQCPACAGEAAAMGRLTERLQQELRAWVEAGTAPPELEQQLRLAVRSAAAVDVEEVLRVAEVPPSRWRDLEQERRRERRRTAWTAAAAAAVAGLLFISLPGGREAAQRLPLVGGLVQFFSGGEAVNRRATAGGVTLWVTRVAATPGETRVIYRLEGLPGGLAGRDAREVTGELWAGGQRLPLVSVALGPGDAVEAVYGPAPAGQPLRLRLERLPAVDGGPWQVDLR